MSHEKNGTKFDKNVKHPPSTWLAIFLGQVLSGILAVSAITSVYLIDYYKIHVPNAQNFAFYIVLAAIFTTILACRPAERNLFPILRTRGWKYALVALVDAEANFAVGKAYQFTTLTSVQLLDCFTIPTVLSLSWLVLRIRYKVPHILGVSICLLGVSCLVWADIEEGKPLAQGKDRFLGDMLCLAGAFLYGISNVAQEFVVKTFDIVEFLGMIGLFGSFVSGAQTVLLEYGAVTSTEWAGPSTQMALLIGFATSKFFFYILSAVVMKLSSATAFNLSILTADFYSLITGIYLFHFKFHALYFLSFLLVMTGVIVFAIKPTVIDSHIYRSLTREHTTTLDLELMASTPSSIQGGGYHHGFGGENDKTTCSSSSFANRHNHHHDEEVCVGGAGSLLSETSHLLSCGNEGRSPMLSNQSCDVVLQTTCSGTHANKQGATQTSWTGTNGELMKNVSDLK
ncbi:Solute carrier family 35 member F1 [Orchesella cincta]|uniref:Solute carrier family 35 member F1 n=1 Tax=Orchesella cincta TaxID=48709 RepID=A0A1D2MGY1_ORCCI|nr:Solute carrier family 35 member F1 [Orchesella cincta]